jgi:hypothetical protein
VFKCQGLGELPNTGDDFVCHVPVCLKSYVGERIAVG